MSVTFSVCGVAKQAWFEIAQGTFHDFMKTLGYTVPVNGPEEPGMLSASELKHRLIPHISSQNEYVRSKAEKLFALAVLAGEKEIQYV